MLATASFRITGDSLDPSSLTAAIGVKPDAAHAKGELGRGSDRLPSRTGGWRIESKLPKTEPLDEVPCDFWHC